MIKKEKQLSSVKAFVLFSGGLDSILAAKILEKQGLEVEGICFESNFYNSNKAIESAEQIGIKLHVLDIRQEMLNIIKHAPHGYGKNLNPCIDCHAMMIRQADQYLKKKNKNYFLASGEVLGQRPFSQNKQALETVKKTSGADVLRPLSAKLLPETEIEIKGWVDRKKLGDISGRSREAQFKLAKKFKIKSFPTPSGGCLLTDSEFSGRLKKMLDFWPNAGANDIELLKNGRVFWFKTKAGESALAVVGRNRVENENLADIAKTGDIMVELKEMTGPLTIVRISNFQFPISKEFSNINLKIPVKLDNKDINQVKNVKDLIQAVCLLTGWYSVKARGKKVNIKLKNKLIISS